MTTKESNTNVSENILTQHWNNAYTKNPTEKLGWYEENSTQTIALIKDTGLAKDATILNVGAGSSLLIDELLTYGYTNLIANDLSEKAINDLKNRLQEKASEVNFIVDDLTKPTKLTELSEIDLWNDRAVLHFFLKKEEQDAYFNLLKQLVKKEGFVIIAVFALNGAEKCCGLPLQRYDANMLQEKLGTDFALIKDVEHTFINPYNGERPYTYALFQRKNK